MSGRVAGTALPGGHVDGAAIGSPYELTVDVAVVGSGPAGAAVAREAARGGARVAVVEAGPWVDPAGFSADGFTAFARYYRDMGASVVLGRPPMPFVQGRAVGGSSLINGAISWRLPRDVYDGWVAADPALAEALPWKDVDAAVDRVEADLGIAPTDPAIAGPNNLLLGRGAEALGLDHRPIRRNVAGCEGLGRCLQGCPRGHKQSMDRSYLLDAMAAGTAVFSRCEAGEILRQRSGGGRAVGVRASAAGGGTVTVWAARAVVLAASAAQTPVLLLKNRIRHGPVGEGFQCHPGASMAGRFADSVRLWTGATQGHEVIGLRREGIKFEALGYDIGMVATRLKGVGRALAADVADIAHWANWGAAVKAGARGRVRPGRHGARVRFALGRNDMAKVRRGVQVLGEMMLAAGADYVTPGVHGWHERVDDRATMARFTEEAPWDPHAYAMAVTHMFGTARMGSDPAANVVGVDFQHHTVPGLYVADSSVFPTNTGVNPQTSILALASLCGRELVAG